MNFLICGNNAVVGGDYNGRQIAFGSRLWLNQHTQQDSLKIHLLPSLFWMFHQRFQPLVAQETSSVRSLHKTLDWTKPIDLQTNKRLNEAFWAFLAHLKFWIVSIFLTLGAWQHHWIANLHILKKKKLGWIKKKWVVLN